MTPVILCMSSYFKGVPFLRECKKLGAYVILVTIEDLRDEAWTTMMWKLQANCAIMCACLG